MSRKTNDRKSKIKLISDTMTGFYSVMRNLKEDYKTYSKNYSEEALALLSKSDDFIESVEAVRSRDSLCSIDDDGINNLFLLSQQISELYHLKVQTKIEDEKPKTLPKKIKSEKTFWNTLWGALQGEFNEDPTGTQILIDMGINFIPGVGQVCDARDIAACLKKLVIEKRVDEIMIWVTLLLTAIGCVPYAGDVIKAGCKAILKGADDVVLKILRKLDADDVQKAVKILKTKFTSSIDEAIATVYQWIVHAGNSKYGNRIKGILSSANENLNKAVDLVKKQIDEFEERVFGKHSKTNKSKTIKIENDISTSLSGKWETVNENMSEFSRNYQKQVTGKEGVVWVQNGVKFDGMKDGILLDAKGKYSQFIDKSTGEFCEWFSGKETLVSEARRQISASEGAKIQWYFAEEESLNAVQDLFIDRGITEIQLIFQAPK